ncbi:MAG TPA: hypothetical protein VHE32_14325 [Rhodanobacteraceae bacterium]|jgi:hypothetical protein|nr:hypothetical protein [Rhodanobacteraceae bacterium]
MPTPFAIPILLAAAASPVPAAPPEAFGALVAAENAFASDAMRFGVRRAFLAHFDAGSWLLRPYPVPALDTLARDADDGSRLEWGPELAGVSVSGDLGFTTGPWSAHAPGMDRFAHGHFLSVWKRGADGVWRVAVDGGVSHAALERPVGEAQLVAMPATATRLTADALAKRRHALETADDRLRKSLERGGDSAASAWRESADAEWRVMRPKEMPATGDAAFALAARDPERRGSGPRRALDVAASGDLAYSIGGDPSCRECGSYYRVWRWTDDRWRLLIDIETP